jgi:hypothetical protein
MGRLLQIGAESAARRSREPLLPLAVEIAREQHARPAAFEAQDDRSRVRVLRAERDGVGHEDARRDASREAQAVAPVEPEDRRDGIGRQRGRELRRRFAVPSRQPQGARAHPPDHLGHAAEVVGVRMRDEHRVEARDAARAQERNDVARAGVELPGARRARVHEEPPARASAQEQRIALAHVDHVHAQGARRAPARGNEQEDGEQQAGRRAARRPRAGASKQARARQSGEGGEDGDRPVRVRLQPKRR